MLRLARSVLLGLALCAPLAALPPAQATADVEIDIDVFHDRLAPYGRWFWHPSYGQVWTPRGVPVGWRPYTYGRWAYTGDGWHFDSDDEWGWAPFHYGRWFFDDDLGWAWVPGRRWAPAWVTWRFGRGYVGWAPLPPWADLDDDDFDLDPPHWIFVEEPYFLAPRLRHVIVLPARNVTIIERCRYRARPVYVRERWVNPGVDVHVVEQATHTKVKAVKVREVQAASARGFADGDDEVRVFRPHVRAPKEGDERKAVTSKKAKPDEKAKVVQGSQRIRAARRGEIDEWYDAQGEALRAQQAAESARKRAKGDDQAKRSLQRRHDAEQKALEQGRQREQRVFEERAKIEKRSVKPQDRGVYVQEPRKPKERTAQAVGSDGGANAKQRAGGRGGAKTSKDAAWAEQPTSPDGVAGGKAKQQGR
jgi:hypothetical protein